MNNFSQSISTLNEQVFIEENNTQRIRTMRDLLGSGGSSQIQKYFFPANDFKSMNVGKLTNSQINKHQQVLSHRNRNLLRSLLKSNHQGQFDTFDLKMLQDQGSVTPDSHHDVHQYLTINQMIDFDTFVRKK